jgi:hypothetical protein
METPVMQCTPAFFFGVRAAALAGAPSVTTTSFFRRAAAIPVLLHHAYFVRLSPAFTLFAQTGMRMGLAFTSTLLILNKRYNL